MNDDDGGDDDTWGPLVEFRFQCSEIYVHTAGCSPDMYEEKEESLYFHSVCGANM